jgi:transposase InsO family protein
MARHAMILEKHTAVRIGRVHDGKVMVMRSNLRWCSDGLEFTCWNGEVVRLAFIIDAFDREIISWAAVANAGISGSDVRDAGGRRETLRRNQRPACHRTFIR